MAEPWQRLPGESSTAYGQFRTYCLLGPGRSIARAYREWKRAKGEEIGKGRADAPGRWHNSARRWKWAERAEAWDDEIAEAQRAAQIAEAVKWCERREADLDALWLLADRIQHHVGAMLTLPPIQRTVTREERDEATGAVVVQHITLAPTDWKLADAARLLAIAVEAKTKVHQTTGLDPSTMDEATLRAVARAAWPTPLDDLPEGEERSESS